VHVGLSSYIISIIFGASVISGQGSIYTTPIPTRAYSSDRREIRVYYTYNTDSVTGTIERDNNFGSNYFTHTTLLWPLSEPPNSIVYNMGRIGVHFRALDVWDPYNRCKHNEKRVCLSDNYQLCYRSPEQSTIRFNSPSAYYISKHNYRGANQWSTTIFGKFFTVSPYYVDQGNMSYNLNANMAQTFGGKIVDPNLTPGICSNYRGDPSIRGF